MVWAEKFRAPRRPQNPRLPGTTGSITGLLKKKVTAIHQI
jgi:hypothetical protein